MNEWGKLGEMKSVAKLSPIEWQTIGLIVFSYSLFAALIYFSNILNPIIWIVICGINTTLFMSITHEIVHGHPTRNKSVNKLLVLFPIGWSIPFERFRDTHLTHHNTGELTDPFDDPESWYVTNIQWLTQNPLTRITLKFNNTLFGRMLIGPIIGLGRFYTCEFTSIISDKDIRPYLARVWLKHFALCTLMAAFIWTYAPLSIWQGSAAIYLGHSLLYVRTFLEHQASHDHSERTVIIEQTCPIAFLFLFNNYHFIHHHLPGIPWYRLPGEFKRNRERYLDENGAYVYASYAEIFRKYFFRTKEPVAHPFLRLNQEEQ